MTIKPEVEVKVPPANEFESTQEDRMLWSATNAVIQMGLAKIKDDTRVYSVMLSRIMREIRRKHGVKGAKEALQGLIDTMDEVAKMDQ